MQHPHPLSLDFTLPFPPFDLSSHPVSTPLEYFLSSAGSPTSTTTPSPCSSSVSPFRTVKGFEQGWWLETPFLSPPPTPTSTDDPGHDLFWSTFNDPLLSTWPTAATTTTPTATTASATTNASITTSSINTNNNMHILTPTLPEKTISHEAVQGKRKKKKTGKKKEGAGIKRVHDQIDLGDEEEDENEENVELPESWVYWDMDTQRRFLQTWSSSKLVTCILKLSQPATETPRKWVCVKHKLAAVDALGQRLPSYEDLIAEALDHWHREHQDPWGCQPRFIFKWMAEKYKGMLPLNFKGSATQALKKAWRKGRFLRHERKYRMNPAWKPPAPPKPSAENDMVALYPCESI